MIREGATLITDGSQVCEDLGELPFASTMPTTGTQAPPALPEPEHRVHQALGQDEASIDHLVGLTGLSASEISSLLMKLEIKGLVLALPGHRYIRK